MTRGSVIIPSVILVAGARALAMSASSFWASALFGHLARLHDRRHAERHGKSALRDARLQRAEFCTMADRRSPMPRACRAPSKEAHRTMNKVE